MTDTHPDDVETVPVEPDDLEPDPVPTDVLLADLPDTFALGIEMQQ